MFSFLVGKSIKKWFIGWACHTGYRILRFASAKYKKTICSYGRGRTVGILNSFASFSPSMSFQNISHTLKTPDTCEPLLRIENGYCCSLTSVDSTIWRRKIKNNDSRPTFGTVLRMPTSPWDQNFWVPIMILAFYKHTPWEAVGTGPNCCVPATHVRLSDWAHIPGHLGGGWIVDWMSVSQFDSLNKWIYIFKRTKVFKRKIQ